MNHHCLIPNQDAKSRDTLRWRKQEGLHYQPIVKGVHCYFPPSSALINKSTQGKPGPCKVGPRLKFSNIQIKQNIDDNWVRIALEPLPQRVRWIRVLYSNFSAFTKDQEFLISLHGKAASERFDYVEGFVIVDEGLINNWRSSFFFTQ